MCAVGLTLSSYIVEERRSSHPFPSEHCCQTDSYLAKEAHFSSITYFLITGQARTWVRLDYGMNRESLFSASILYLRVEILVQRGIPIATQSALGHQH